MERMLTYNFTKTLQGHTLQEFRNKTRYVPDGVTEDGLYWDAQLATSNMVKASNILQECVGVWKNSQDKMWPEYHIIIKMQLKYHSQYNRPK